MTDVLLPAANALSPTEDVSRKIAISTVAQLGAKGVHLVLNVVSTVVLIRYMGPTRYGDYIKVITVTSWAGLLSEFGLTKLAVREVAREAASVPPVVGTVIVVRLVLSVAAAAFVQLILLAIGASAVVHAAALVMSTAFVLESLLATVIVFHVSLRQQYEAVVRLVMEAVELTVLLVLVAHHAQLVALVSAPVFGAIAGAVFAYALARRRFALRLSFDATRVRHLLREAAPIVPAIMVGVLTVKFDGFMVAALRSRHDAGLYGAAFQPIEYAFLAITVVAYPFFPLLARWHGTDRLQFEKVYRRGTEALLAFVLPIPVVLAIVAGPLVTAVYRPEWSASATPLRVLAIALVPMSVSAWHGFVLLAGDRQRVTIRYGVVALATTVVLCVTLIPTIGYMGGAWAALGANSLSAVLAFGRVRALLDVHVDVNRIGRLVLASGLLGVALVVAGILGAPWWAQTLAAAPLYIAALGACGLLRAEGLRDGLSTPLGLPALGDVA
jgi:O-antigen/teichoic acid export membrane protein